MRRQMSDYRQILGASFLGVCAFYGTTDAIANEEAPRLETVIVTAQYRKEDAQNVSIATSILGEASIVQQDIHDPDAIALHVPGMSYAEFAPGQALVAIRGIISADDGPGMDNSIAVFLDGVYIGRQAMVNFDLYDIERIEVLKGPQGSLFGRNAIGGAINIITRMPTSSPQGHLSLTRGNYNAVRTNAYVAGELSDGLNASLSVNQRQRDGYTKNVLLGVDNQDEDTESVRTRWQYERGRTVWELHADYTSDKRGDMGRTPVRNNGAFDYVSLWQSLGGDENRSTAPIDGRSERRAKGVSLHALTTFDAGTATVIGAWRDASSVWEMASIGAPFGGGIDLSTGVYGIDVNDDINEQIQQRSLELRWTSADHDTFTYAGGAFLLQESTDRIEQFKLDRNALSTGLQTVGNEVSDQKNTTDSYALYGHAKWWFHPQWALIGGARFTQDHKQVITRSLNCGDQSNPLVANYAACDVGAGSLGILQRSFRVEGDHSWTDFSPKLAVEFHPRSDAMVYASITKGFKSGGFGGSPGVEGEAQTPIDPEVVWSYELGLKSDWWQKRARTNLSVFYMDYEDLQVVHFGPSPSNPSFGSFTTTNIKTSTISGLEVEGQLLLNDYIDISGNYAYLDSEVEDFQLTTGGGVVDLSGSSLRQAPEHSSTLALNAHVPLAHNRGTLHGYLDYQYKGEQISDYINQNTRIDAVELFNANLRWQSEQETFTVTLWVKNIKDTRYISHAYSIGPGVIGIWGAPRTSGITWAWALQ